MNTKLTLYIICFVFLFGIFSVIFPYPVFSATANLTPEEIASINDAHEEELYNPTKPPSIQVLNLNWFDTVDTFFTKFTTVRVIDVQTKKEYYVQRTGGYNHADVEPIDTANANIFKSLYGGEWSWVRRPVWVEIQGEFVAASINGMPHGYSLLAKNPIGGHTCIHFLLSKTHGTKKVDPDHQNAIKAAIERKDEINDVVFGTRK